MEQMVHCGHASRLRRQLLRPAWICAGVVLIVYSIAIDYTAAEERRDAARREARAHAAHIAATLPRTPTEAEVDALHRLIGDVLGVANARAIAVYGPSRDRGRMSRIAAGSLDDTPPALLPPDLLVPRDLIELELRDDKASGDLWLATARAVRAGEVIGVVRVVTTVGGAGDSALWTLGLALVAIALLLQASLISRAASGLCAGVDASARRIEALQAGDHAAACAPASDGALEPLRAALVELSRTIESDGETTITEVDTLRTHLAERSHKLEEAMLEMQSLDRAKETFLSSLSHEMRTPLTSIIAAEEILRTYADDEIETREEFLEIIRQESRRLLTLIGKLLDLAQLEARALRLNLEETELGQLVEDTAHGLFTRKRDKRVGLSVSRRPDEVMCECDRERVSRILHSLLENAFFYSPDNGTIRIAVSQTDDHALVRVEDAAPNTDERWFDVFELDGTGPDTPGDALLGHAVVARLVKAHGGTLTRASTPSRGSLIELRLPLRHTAAVEMVPAKRRTPVISG